MNRFIKCIGIVQRNSSVSQTVKRRFAFRSDISPEALYPNSKQQIYTPPLPEVRNFHSGFRSVFIHTSSI